MGALRYLLVIGCLGVLALFTVAEHVKRTRLGYALRQLEQERSRLKEEEKAQRLAYEAAGVPARLLERAQALRVTTPAELEALAGVRQ